MVERLHGMQEVVGSIPIASTITVPGPGPVRRLPAMHEETADRPDDPDVAAVAAETLAYLTVRSDGAWAFYVLM